jgi:FAD/FMN-containing dehydrogenase
LGWGASHGLVIDLTGMKRLSIDPARRIGRVDAGVSGAEVVRSAGRYGLAPVLGQCPDVGAAGITLGGGLGWLSGLHGASCDNLVSARIVAPNGAILPVDAERNPELLWGLRGAGANFGVATSLELRLHPVETVTAGDIYYPAREARPVLRFFRTLMAEAPDSFQATINLTTGARGVFIMLCHAGSGVEAERLCRNLRTVATPSRDTIRRQRFAELADQKYVASSVDANFRYVTTAYRNQLSGEVVDAALDSLSGAPPEMVLGISHYLHGEVCRVAPDSTAFPLREQGGIHIRASVDWNDPAAAPRLMRWADEVRRRLRPASGERIYANYQSYDGQGSAEAVFGANLARLAALKNRYDPANLFRRNSNIEPRQA